jgi:isopentenyl phosphate kinase
VNKHLVFLKLGGSLVTVKEQPHTPRLEVLERLALEISDAITQYPGLKLLLGHGSGSFGHTPASLYHTRQGVRTAKEWQGFAEVRHQAAELDRLVLAALEKAHLPVIAFPPSARVVARQGRVAIWDLDPIQAALYQGVLPVIYGDVAYDQDLGGTVLSTEALFSYAAHVLKPACLLFAGLEPGVWADYPGKHQLLEEITPASFPALAPGLKGSVAIDVTGGMLDKVQQLVDLVNQLPGLRGMIFTGETPGNVRRALLGELLGTLIHAG